MKKTYVSWIAVLMAFMACQPASEKDMDNFTLIEQKIDSLLALMTLEEKVGQLNQYSIGEEMTGPSESQSWANQRYEMLISGKVGSVLNLLGAETTRKMQQQVVEKSRLGIPLLFAYDVIHGYQTIFPIPLAEAAAWDAELARKTAAAAAAESAASGLHWTFAPMVDISYDARWGRVMEGAGEDPYLGSQLAAARVKGFQGDDLADPLTIAACAKHFVGYGFVGSGKDYNNVNFDQYTLLNEVLPPFKAAVEAGAATFMTAFNDYNAMPASGNNYLLRDILRSQLGFNGLVVSDWNSIGEMVSHRVATDNKEAARLAILAGTDIDMEANAYNDHLMALVDAGIVPISVIDASVRNVLRLKYQLGLFDDPYKYSDVAREKEVIGSEEFKSLAREAAQKSIVLLKNEKNILPLTGKEKLAVIGPLAKDKDSPLGNWRAHAVANSAVSFFEGLVAQVENPANIKYAEGVKLSIGPNNFFEKLVIEQNDRSGIAEAVAAARQADKVIMVLGETAYMSGEARSRADIGLPGLQLELLQKVYEVNKNIILVLMNGRPLTLTWEAEHLPAIVEAWHLGSEAGHAIADVMLGKYNPSGKLPMSFPRHVGQLPMHYHHKTTGRPSSGPNQVFYVHHADVESSALFPFGHGLSYTTFAYEELVLSAEKIAEAEKLIVKVKVSNTGSRAGEEVVQLYIKDEIASRTRPEKELKAFRKVALEAGESKWLEFELGKKDLGFYLDTMEMVTEPGFFEIMVGGSSQTSLNARFEYTSK